MKKPNPRAADMIRAARAERGWSLSQVAERVYVTRQAIHAWEVGIAYPKDKNLDRLCCVLGLPYEELKRW